MPHDENVTVSLSGSLCYLLTDEQQERMAMQQG